MQLHSGRRTIARYDPQSRANVMNNPESTAAGGVDEGGQPAHGASGENEDTWLQLCWQELALAWNWNFKTKVANELIHELETAKIQAIAPTSSPPLITPEKKVFLCYIEGDCVITYFRFFFKSFQGRWSPTARLHQIFKGACPRFPFESFG